MVAFVVHGMSQGSNIAMVSKVVNGKQRKVPLIEDVGDFDSVEAAVAAAEVKFKATLIPGTRELLKARNSGGEFRYLVMPKDMDEWRAANAI